MELFDALILYVVSNSAFFAEESSMWFLYELQLLIALEFTSWHMENRLMLTSWPALLNDSER